MYFKLCDAIFSVLRKILIALGLILLVAVTLQVAGRYVPFIPRWLWPLEVANWAMIWMVFIGASMGLRENRHFLVDLFLGKKLPEPFFVFLRVVYYAILGGVTLVFIFFGYSYLVRWGLIQSSEIMGINLGFLYASVPLAGVLWLLFLIENILKDLSGKTNVAHTALDAAQGAL